MEAINFMKLLQKYLIIIAFFLLPISFFAINLLSIIPAKLIINKTINHGGNEIVIVLNKEF